jgi:hypothetical protein
VSPKLWSIVLHLAGELPAGQGAPAARAPSVGALDAAISRVGAVAASEIDAIAQPIARAVVAVGGAAAVVSGLFGPDDADRRFAELERAWAEVDAAGPLENRLKPTRDEWLRFQSAWHDAEANLLTPRDVAGLTAHEADVRRLRLELRCKSPDDPRWAKDKDPQGGDIENATPALQASASVNQAVKDVPWLDRLTCATGKGLAHPLDAVLGREPGAPVPTPYKVAAIAGLAVLGLGVTAVSVTLLRASLRGVI